MTPVVHECAQREDAVDPIVCATGQHREMLRQVTDYFGVTEDINLDLMTPNQSLAKLTARCVIGIDEAITRFAPHCLVVQGDTTTVLAGSLAAFYRRIPLVHVEAGLRTGDMTAPWPEEFNRRVTSLVTSLHCAPTRRSANNLLREGTAKETVYITGNTVIDALLYAVKNERKNDESWRAKHPSLGDRRMVLITGHRRENFGGGFENICRSIQVLSDRFPDVVFLYPVHLNPNVQGPVHQTLGGRDNVVLIPPVAYPEFVWLMDRSTIILSDSGGVQEEAPSLKKPVLVMRNTTERPEAVEAGAVELVGTSIEKIVSSVSTLLTDQDEYERRQIDENPYGDGHAARRIVDLMLKQNWA